HTRFSRDWSSDVCSSDLDPNSSTFPSSLKQKDLAKVLVEELKALGASEVEMDEWGYVFATVPSNSGDDSPTICFCSHMDTAPDRSEERRVGKEGRSGWLR